MKYIKRLRLNENTIESSIEELFVSVTDIIGANALTVEKNGDGYKLNISYNIKLDGIESIIETHQKINTILEESMESVEKLKLYYDVSYNLFETTYHNNFASFSLKADLSKKR